MNKRASPFALYRATVGRRRQFETEVDAHAYERGYNNYPSQPKNTESTAEQQGYLDAKAAADKKRQ